MSRMYRLLLVLVIMPAVALAIFGCDDDDEETVIDDAIKYSVQYHK